MDFLELIKKAGQNNRLAQRQVYDLYARKMFLLCRQYTKDDLAAEEIVIDGFLRFFRRLRGFNYINEPATRSFLQKIMITECLRHHKRNKALFVVPTEELPECGLPAEIITRLGAKEIYELIEQLPLGYRTVFNLVVMENKTHREVAAALNISEKTSQSQFRGAKYKLQQLLIQLNKDYANRTKHNKREAE